MPVLNLDFWREREIAARDARARDGVSDMSPCHYREYWQDLYATRMRRRAMEELFARLPLKFEEMCPRVLDVGCGDGRFGAWVARRFKVPVSGVDAFAFGAYDRLQRFCQMDAENVSQIVPKWGHFDVALLITVLPFVENPQKVLEELTHVAPFLIVLDNFQDPAPPWQLVLSYKRHIPVQKFFDMLSHAGWEFEFMTPVNVIDRALFVRTPRALYPLAYVATLLGEKFAMWMLNTARWDYSHVRYSALLLKNQKWSADK